MGRHARRRARLDGRAAGLGVREIVDHDAVDPVARGQTQPIDLAEAVSLEGLVLMPLKGGIDVIQFKLGQFHDLGLRPDLERQHGQGVLPTASFQNDPRFVIPIQTAPIGVDQKV